MSDDQKILLKVAYIGLIGTILGAIITITPQLYEKIRQKEDAPQNTEIKKEAIDSTIDEKIESIYLLDDNLCEVIKKIMESSSNSFERFRGKPIGDSAFHTTIHTTLFQTSIDPTDSIRRENILSFVAEGNKEYTLPLHQNSLEQLRACFEELPESLYTKSSPFLAGLGKRFRYNNKVIILTYIPSFGNDSALVSLSLPDFDGDRLF